MEAAVDKEHKAVERLRLAAEMSETYYAKPLIITTSGAGACGGYPVRGTA